MLSYYIFCFFFFIDTATPEIYTLSLHDALPICSCRVPSPRNATGPPSPPVRRRSCRPLRSLREHSPAGRRSEEHTSELQSQSNLVCRLLLEKKKKKKKKKQ